MKHLIKLLIPIVVSLFMGAAQAQTECPSSQILRFEDGSKGCMSEYKFFNLQRNFQGGKASISETVAGKDRYFVAWVKNPKICPADQVSVDWGGVFLTQGKALNQCEDTVTKRVVTVLNKNPAGCECEIVYNSHASPNILMSKSAFESRSRAWLAVAQNGQYHFDFTEEEKKANTLFLAEYLKQLDGGQTTSPATQQANTAADKKLQDELTKKLQLDKEQKDLAEKARLEKEKSLAEDKRLAQEIAQKGQLDKEAANKARLEKEKSLAEEKRLAQELAKVQALEKEKADLITKLQQEKDAREKAAASKPTNDEARILALRKELEKEIRASIQSESAAAPSGSKAKQAPPVFANRKALVIGNDSYQKVTPLVNAREDAKVVAESLTSLGYKVSLKLDVTEKQFKSELRTFKAQIQPGDEVAIFYAGHGVQIASTNYLLPIDIGGQNEEETKDEGISLQRLLDDMTEKSAKFTLAMIDA
ncbi:MAG: caspase family protein, partial [Polynucleobacter sp.]